MSDPLRSQGLKASLLNRDELYEIHLATLDVLERIGVGIYEDRALKLMDEAGAIARVRDRGSMGDWVKAGRKDICELARERAKKILASHIVEPLEKDVRKEMWEIVKKAETELKD
ncbi:MAG: trimethylamine methyltransferase family protein [Candidatus Bathyarchaeota archaeon]|nr:MAG: trimethylamine methyltransferase family protein [Candidatus Bathyarchaeota archaeon]